jgi:hypothetical protein
MFRPVNICILITNVTGHKDTWGLGIKLQEYENLSSALNGGELSALCSGCAAARETYLHSHWIGKWMGFRDRPYAVANRETSTLLGVELRSSHPHMYTDRNFIPSYLSPIFLIVIFLLLLQVNIMLTRLY